MNKRFCLDCKEEVETYMELLKGFSLCCKNCGSNRLMKLDKMNEKEFGKFAKEFKKKTGEVE